MNLKSSIIMTTYNGEKFIYEQLKSIMNQNQKPDEVLIFDDGSTDSTVEIIESFILNNKVSNWKLIENSSNKGYKLNFLSGILESSGDLIFLCDQDDIWMENKIKFCTELFIENSEILALHSDTDIIDESNVTIEKNTQQYTQDLLKFGQDEFKKKMNYPGMALVLNGKFAKESVSRILDSKKVIPTHDWTLCALACINDGFYTSNKVLTKRRFHENNVALQMNNKKSGELEERLWLLEKYLNYYQLYNFFNETDDLEDDFYILTSNRIKIFKSFRFEYLYNIVIRITKYPSRRAILADTLYLFRMTKLIKKYK